MMTRKHSGKRASDPPTPRRFVTIREVAADAGVGIATVSRALNNSGYVADEVRQRILTSAEKLGYRASERARSMRSLKTMTIGVLVPELGNPVYLEFLRGVEEVAHSRGYVTLIGSTQHDPAREKAILDRMVAERVDGIVVGSVVGGRNQLNQVAARSIPIVPPLGPAGRRDDRAWVASESAATEHMARRLFELGHRRVHVVYRNPGIRDVDTGRFRRSRTDVIRKTMGAVGAALHHVVLPDTHDVVAAGEMIVEDARSSGSSTAYVAASHLVAPAVLYALKLMGVEIPGGVSFVTYGDSHWAAAYRPALSVVRHDIHGEAIQLTNMLLEMIDGGSGRSTVSYESRFVERESCGPVPRGRRQQARANSTRHQPHPG